MRIVGACAALLMLTACSPATAGMNRMANALADTSSSYSRDADPEFVRIAAPSTLKMVEMMLDGRPRHGGLLMTACSGFTQYAYAFLQVDAEIVEPRDKAAAAELKSRAGRMYDRARGYCMRALELTVPGLQKALSADAKGALARVTRADVPALYWTAAALGGSIVTSSNPLLRVGELPVVRALLTRALELDERWEKGAIHEMLIALEALPPLLGGSPARARAHFDRAVELSGGHSAFAYVTMATSVTSRDEASRLLNAALKVDVNQRPEIRLANLVAQKRARFLLSSGK